MRSLYLNRSTILNFHSKWIKMTIRGWLMRMKATMMKTTKSSISSRAKSYQSLLFQRWRSQSCRRVSEIIQKLKKLNRNQKKARLKILDKIFVVQITSTSHMLTLFSRQMKCSLLSSVKTQMNQISAKWGVLAKRAFQKQKDWTS